MPDYPCDQLPASPPAGASPEVLQCYADAYAFLENNCPGCTTEQCKSQLRALYSVWIGECNAMQGYGANHEFVLGMRAIRTAMMRKGAQEHGWKRGTDGD